MTPPSRSARRRPAYLTAGLMLALGLLALLFPATFAALVNAMQDPPKLYVIAAIRAAMGIALLLAAEGSRARLAVFFLGFVLVAGGIVTPFIGHGIARWIVDAWIPGGGGVVRAWGGAAIVLAGFTFWALRARTPSAGTDGAPIP